MRTHSLHLGINHVDLAHYQKLPTLRAAVNDAHDWARMARELLNYAEQEILTDEQATADALLQRLDALAGALQPGDALLLTYSGHGGQIPDGQSPNPGDEEQDQTWCLYDRQLIDDELYLAFSRFQAGVRISVVADCCHSGTSIREVNRTLSKEEYAQAIQEQITLGDLEKAGFIPRRMSREQSARVFNTHYDQYTALLQNLSEKRLPVQASVQLFAACQDEQITYDGSANGIFTDAFKTLLYSGEWRQWQSTDGLLERLRAFFRYPRPNYLAYGGDLSVFEGSFPLMADAPTTTQRQTMTAPVVADEVPVQSPTPKPRTTPPPFYKIRLELPDGMLDARQIEALCPPGATGIRIDTAGNAATVLFPGGQYPSVWEPLHHIAQQADEQWLDLIVEPAATPAVPLEDDTPEARSAEELGYLPYWPPVTEQQNPPIGWHLDAQHSQLAAARDLVWAKLKNGELRENVRIAHLDTGWLPWHPGFAYNPNIRRDLTRTFIDSEDGINQPAIDLQYKDNEQQGHGSGTLGVLACWALDPKYTDDQELGFLGAIPFAEIVPLRIADSVLIFDTENFCKALEYAIGIGCEVVTMSMGGKPSRRMAKVINKAYEKGITIVTAAGNNMARGLSSIGPKTVVWPARFERVIAACGACHNHFPYDFEAQEKYGGRIKSFDVRNMQGNWGPGEAMTRAIAAYSPNISWVYGDDQHPLRKSGGGTSAVTPQVAAAAALWITLHKAELKQRGYAGTWKQVEAVREALFQTADRSFVESAKYYGNGILRAHNALQYPVPDIPEHRKSAEASSTIFGLGELFSLFLKRHRGVEPGPALRRTLELELQGVLLDDGETAGVGHLDAISTAEVLAAVERAGYCSEALRESIGG